jgi:hypothetical protein
MSKVVEQKQNNNTIRNNWSNYETCLANLWLADDQNNYLILIEALNIKDKTINQANCLKKYLSWQLEDKIEEPGLWQDLLDCAFDRINWIEVINKNLDLID